VLASGLVSVRLELIRSGQGIVLSLVLAGCGADDAVIERRTEPLAGAAAVDFTLAHQHIAGFGASSAWTANELSEELADEFFSVRDGIGLSLLRVRIDPSGRTGERGTARQAVARGAAVWASPWSPPGEWKDNGSTRNGGSLLPERRTAWAERLASFAKSMADDDLPLLVLSAQNEPNWTAEWETCRWTEDELADFIRDELGPALERVGVPTPILAPETINWDSVRLYGDRLMDDPEARKYLGALATHSYGGDLFRYNAPADNGLELWQTEVSDDGGDAADPGMDSALRVAKLIHDHLSFGHVSAWHYWWLVPRADLPPDNASLTIDGALARRAHALGNWSKFVRPGFVRVEAPENPREGIWMTAFRAVSDARFVIVAINEKDVETPQPFELVGSAAKTIVPWVTSDEHALAEQEPLTVEPAGFSHTLAPRSITTFTGMLDGSDPDPFTEGGAGGSPSVPPASMAGRAGAPAAFPEPGRGGGTACICAMPGAKLGSGRTALLLALAAPGLFLAARRRSRALRLRSPHPAGRAPR
jgi:glucuronoarabinoxylan endo-1,4-beta-xylanase